MEKFSFSFTRILLKLTRWRKLMWEERTISLLEIGLILAS